MFSYSCSTVFAILSLIHDFCEVDAGLTCCSTLVSHLISMGVQGAETCVVNSLGHCSFSFLPLLPNKIVSL
jgi:hypothetical protein